MKYFVDIDGTIADTPGNDYRLAEPKQEAIFRINEYYDAGHHITYWSARGTDSGKDWYALTERQLHEWGCRYHELRLGKPGFDFIVDDRCKKIEEL